MHAFSRLTVLVLGALSVPALASPTPIVLERQTGSVNPDDQFHRRPDIVRRGFSSQHHWTSADSFAARLTRRVSSTEPYNYRLHEDHLADKPATWETITNKYDFPALSDEKRAALERNRAVILRQPEMIDESAKYVHVDEDEGVMVFNGNLQPVLDRFVQDITPAEGLEFLMEHLQLT